MFPQPDIWLALLSASTLAIMFGAGVAWGLNKKTVSALQIRVKSLEENHDSVEDSMERIDDEVKKVMILLTGATGNNGLIGDIKLVKDKVEGISDLVVAICTKMDIPIRRAFK